MRPAGVPTGAILAAAEDVGADRVVIGSRSESRARSLFLGRVARAVIRQTSLPPLPTWIEPTAEATREAREAACAGTRGHVLLATDFSRHAAAAEAATEALAAVETLPHLPVMAEVAPAAINGRVESLPIGSTAGVCRAARRPC